MARVVHNRIGSELLGYRIEALLGRGGMGVVYRAYEARLKRRVALKLLAPDLVENDRFRERFLRESELAASLDHASIVPIYDAGEVDGQLYIAMRYVKGTDLSALLHKKGALEPARAVAVCAQVADALDTAHARGLVHRDVKPSNVLVDERGHCYLADFGLTRRIAERDDPSRGRTVGTVDYVAPEQIGGEEVGRAADVYSLGCLLYECLTGDAPFRRSSAFAVLFAHLEEPPPSAVERNPQLPEALDAVITRALAKEPCERYGTCGELLEAARLALETNPRRRRRLLLAALAAAAAALAVVLPPSLTGGKTVPSAKPTLAITADSIQRIDPTTSKLAATIRLPAGLQGPQPLAVGGGFLWAASQERNAIFQIDPRRNALNKTLGGTGEPTALAYGAGSLWVLNARDGIVSRIDPQTSAVTAAVPLPAGSAASGVEPGGGVWLRANDDAVWLSWLTPTTNAIRIDPRTTVARAVQLGPPGVGSLRDLVQVGSATLWAVEPRRPLRGPYTSVLYRVALRRGNPRAVQTVPVRGDACCTLAADRESVWLAGSGRVLRFDSAAGRVRASSPLRGEFFGLTLGAGGLWVSSDQGTVSRIDSRRGTVVASTPVGGRPDGLASVGEGGVWVAVRPR